MKVELGSVLCTWVEVKLLHHYLEIIKISDILRYTNLHRLGFGLSIDGMVRKLY